MSSFSIADPADAAGWSISLYRSIWRWHFFAGLLVVPFLLNLAVTGSLYLFKDEINGTVFGYRYLVKPEGRTLSSHKLLEVAVATLPGSTATSYKDPASPERSVVVTVSKGKVATEVFLNPYDGKVLDAVPSEEEFNYVVKHIHSLALFGDFTNKLIEITAGFAMVLVVTGIYLWWPRQQTGGVLTVRGTPARRIFWRDLHAVTGAFAGILMFLLALTGMPSSTYWGANVNSWLGIHGLVYNRCPEAFPTTLYEVARWLDELGKKGRPLRAVFFSIDPERDIRVVMHDYVNAFGDRITGVTGTPDEMRTVGKGWFMRAEKEPLTATTTT